MSIRYCVQGYNLDDGGQPGKYHPELVACGGACVVSGIDEARCQATADPSGGDADIVIVWQLDQRKQAQPVWVVGSFAVFHRTLLPASSASVDAMAVEAAVSIRVADILATPQEAH